MELAQESPLDKMEDKMTNIVESMVDGWKLVFCWGSGSDRSGGGGMK